MDLDDFLENVTNSLGESNWIPLYQNLNKEDKSEDGSLFSCLIEQDETNNAMTTCGWDLMIGSGGPSLILSGNKVWYESQPSPYFPIVIKREFHGVRKSYKEISQELVLFHNLYHDKKSQQYVVDDDNGLEISVIKYNDDEILIRRSFLYSFMAAKQMNFLLFFELTRHKSSHEQCPDERVLGNEVSYTRYWGPSYVKGFNVFTRLLGKKLFYCSQLTEENADPFPKEKEYQKFIISGDEHDFEMFSCEHEQLANYFGGNIGNPHYLTPVFFKREVLQKYYNTPSEYAVSDSSIRKKGFWSIRIDNNHPNYVCVFLGDLGRDIPSSEQIHWKSYNIAPDGKNMSKTYFERSMLGQPSEPLSPDLRFKHYFPRFLEQWNEKFGWDIFLPLGESDLHCFESLHSLTSNEQGEFDSQILYLVKITIDSLNVKEMNRIMGTKESASIKLFTSFIGTYSVDGDETRFLSGLQGIRSSGVAHRRGSRYEDTIKRLDIKDENLIEAFDSILERMINLLSILEEKIING